jgi:hypothetical protein
MTPDKDQRERVVQAAEVGLRKAIAQGDSATIRSLTAIIDSRKAEMARESKAEPAATVRIDLDAIYARRNARAPQSGAEIAPVPAWQRGTLNAQREPDYPASATELDTAAIYARRAEQARRFLVLPNVDPE